MAIDLYMHPVSPPSCAVRAVARLLGVELNEKFVDLMKQQQLEPDYLKVCLMITF